MTAGTELMSARERAGLSPAQISERTKIQLYKIAALERDDYAQLPQGIYLDGIVRAYAHEVGIDPEPMVDRVRSERGKLPGDWEVPFAAPIDLHGGQKHDTPDLDDIPVLARSDAGNPLDGFAAESDLKAAATVRHEHRVTPTVYETPPLDEAPAVYHQDILRAAPEPLLPAARPTRQRSGMLLPLLILLAAAGLGVYFYQAARALDRDRVTVATGEARRDAAFDPRESPPADTPVRFSENAISPEAGKGDTSDVNSRAVPRDTSDTSDTVAIPARPVPTSGSRPAPASRPAAPPARTTASAPPAQQNVPAEQPAAGNPAARPGRIEHASVSPDVTGSWRLATQIESSSVSRFQGLTLGYEMQLEQDGDRVTGTGRKISENGNGIGRRAQTPVTVSGTIAGDRLTLNFVERGARRPTQGKFVLLVDEEGTLRGRFSSNAAGSSGRVEAHRVERQ